MRDAITHQQTKLGWGWGREGARSGRVRVRTPARNQQAELTESSLKPRQRGLVPEVALVQWRKKAKAVLSVKDGLPWLRPKTLA